MPKTTKLKWYKPSEKMPPVQKGGYRTSIRVLLKWRFKGFANDPQISFGCHVPGTNTWRIEGVSSTGGFKVYHWAIITFPGKPLKVEKVGKRKKSKVAPLHNK